MPKNYSAGGRVLAGSSPGGPGQPEGRSWRERFGALANVRPFLAMVWRTSPSLTGWNLSLRIVRALLPVATLYVGKLIIDEVVALSSSGRVPSELGEWLASGLFERLLALLLVEFALAVTADILGRAVSLLD